MQQALSCVIFDIDGTMAKTNDLIFASFNHVISRHLGKTMSPREIIGLFGPPEEGALSALFGHERSGPLMDELCEFYHAHHATLASLHPGIDRVLEMLKGRGISLAVFTGKGTRTTNITLDALGLREYFDCVVTGNDVVNHKPHPEGILRVLAQIGVPAGAALMVGDSPVDVAASRAAGVPVASVLWDCHDPDAVVASNSECVFHTVNDMERWLRARLQEGKETGSCDGPTMKSC
jgi:HAD superfamily hydrolase (TIGR01509 family)